MATYTNTTKNSASWANLGVSAYLGYILTDDTSKILVGENEDLHLVWNTPNSYTNQSKSIATFTNQSKSSTSYANALKSPTTFTNLTKS